jgi:ankyrin repeat protein
MEQNNNNNNNKRNRETLTELPLNDSKKQCLYKSCNNNNDCTLDQILDDECMECLNKTYMNNPDYKNELPIILHQICSLQKHDLLKCILEMHDEIEKARVLNYVHKGKTPLQISIEKCDIRSIDMFLRQSLVDIFKIPRGQISPFTAAFEVYHKEVCGTQVQADKYLDSDNEAQCFEIPDYKTLLLNTTTSTHITPFRLLLFKLNSILKSITTTNDYLNPETMAFKYILQIVKTYSVVMNKAIDSLNYDALYLMLSTGISYKILSSHPEFHLPIFAAVYKGDLVIMNMLMDFDTPFDVKKKSDQIPIHVLSAKGFLTSLKLIIAKYYTKQKRIKVNTEIKEEYNYDNIISDVETKTEIEFETDAEDETIFVATSDTQMTILHFAALNNNPNTLKYILSLKQSQKYLNNRNKNGSTALLCACSKGNTECVKIILNVDGVDVLTGDIHGNTPLVYACYYNRNDVVKVFLDKINKDLSNRNVDNIEDLLVEKTKWINLSIVQNNRDTNNTNSNNNYYLDVLISLKNINNMNGLIENLKHINNTLNVYKREMNNKIPSLEIKMDNFERGSGVLRQFIHTASELFTYNSILRKIFDYSTPKLTTEPEYGYKTNINLQEHYLYLPYFTNITLEDIEQMKYLGFLLFISLLHQPISMPLSPVFFKTLTNEVINLNDILPFDLNNYTDNDIEEYNLTMSVRAINADGNSEEYDLVVNGRNILVTKDNVAEYKKLLLEFYTIKGERKLLLDAFKSGFLNLFNQNMMQYINHCELIDLIIKKTCIIPLNEWKENTKINHNQASEPKEIKWFWKYLSSLDNKKISKLIEFFSGSPNLPPGNLKRLKKDNHPFTIQYSPAIVNGLPWSYTCTFTLHIPQYESKEKLFYYFDYALEYYQGFQFV